MQCGSHICLVIYVSYWYSAPDCILYGTYLMWSIYICVHFPYICVKCMPYMYNFEEIYISCMYMATVFEKMLHCNVVCVESWIYMAIQHEGNVIYISNVVDIFCQ